MSAYHIGANLGARPKHQLALFVGVVYLARQECGKLIRSADGLIQEALPVSGADRREECVSKKKKQKSTKTHHSYHEMCTHWAVLRYYSIS